MRRSNNTNKTNKTINTNNKKGVLDMRHNSTNNSNSNTNTNTNSNSKKGEQTMKNSTNINEKFASLCAENAALRAKMEAKIEAIAAENASLKAMIEDAVPALPVSSNVVLTQKGTVSKKPNRADRAYQTALSSKDWSQSLLASPVNDASKGVYDASKSHLKDLWKAIKADKKIGATAYKVMQSIKDEKTLINLINVCQKSIKDMQKPDYGIIHCIIALCSPVVFTTCATSYSMIEGWKVFDKKRAGNAFWGSVCNNRIPSKCSDKARIIPLDRVCISVVRLSDCVAPDNWKSYDTLVTAIKLLSSIDIA